MISIQKLRERMLETREEVVHHIFLLFAISMLVMSLTCCERHTEAWQKMDLAEGLMEDRPDTALKILESITLEDLQKPSDRALYGLLYTQALAKNWLNPTNDTLISLSVNYYKSVDDPYRQAMSNYYQGVVHLNNKNYTSAILSFFKAKETSDSNGIDFYAGMSCRGISDIYNESYNVAEELLFAEKEYEYFLKEGKQPYLNYAILDYGRSLYNNEEFDKANEVFNQLLDSAKLYQDEYLNHEILRLHALNYIAKDRFHEAYPILTENCKDDFSDLSDTLRLCEVLVEIGNIEEASELLDKTSDANIALKKMVEYKIERKEGNYQRAIQKQEFVDSITNNSFRASVSHNLTSSLTDYFKVKEAEDELKIKEARIYRNLTIICSIFVLLLITSIFVRHYRKQSKTISEKVLLAEQLAESLNKSKSKNVNSQEILKSLLSSKYQLFEELCSIAYQYQNTNEKSRRQKVADAVDRLIKDLSTGGDKILELEAEVDSLHDNLFSDFRSDLPKLKDSDYRLFLYLILGFETPTITLLLKENKIEAVYNRKRRLKNKISNLECDNRDRYLIFFN